VIRPQGRSSLFREVEYGDHHLHGVVRSLVDGLHVLTVDEEVHPPGPPISGVDVQLANIDRQLRRIELVGQRRIAERVHAHAHSRRPRAVLDQKGFAEDLEYADLAAVRRLILQTNHPHRGHRPRPEIHPRTHLEQPVVRRPAPLGRLRLAHHQAVAERLLSDGAANRPGEHSRLNA
jgi:hypothetical protein